MVFEAFCECGQKFNESRSYLRSSLGLIRLRPFFVCFATLKNTDKNGSQICFNTYIYLVIFVISGLEASGFRYSCYFGGAALCQTKKHQNNVPRQQNRTTDLFFLALHPGRSQRRLHLSFCSFLLEVVGG